MFIPQGGEVAAGGSEGAAARIDGPEGKRRAIFAAALRLFDERTVGGTAMPLVAERAGVGAGTIYRHFPSKEALANAVFRACKLALQQSLEAGTRPGLSPRQEFGALWRGLWAFAREHPEAFRFLETQAHASYLDPESRRTSDALFHRCEELVRRAQAAGAMRAGDSGALVALAFGAFVGLVKEADLGRFELDETRVAVAEDAVWAMLRPSRGASAALPSGARAREEGA